MPLILSGNVASATADAGYTVANSCRFNDGDSAYMHKTCGSAFDTDKWTISIWFKRGNLGLDTRLISCDNDDGSNDDYIRFDDADQMEFMIYEGSSIVGLLKPNMVFRDVAWYHLVCVWDSANGTAGNRMRMYVNGTEVTSFATDTNPTSGANASWGNTSHPIEVGRRGSNGTQYFDGYIAEVAVCDGQAYAASDFGEFDEDSPTIWKPKDVSGLTFGTSGFYLDFEASDNLGNDANGGTDLTSVNLAATDSATDTPTNNFATMNPLANYISGVTFSEGNLNIAMTTSKGGSTSTFGLTAGKWYVEKNITTIPQDERFHLGIVPFEIQAADDPIATSNQGIMLSGFNAVIYADSGSGSAVLDNFFGNDTTRFDSWTGIIGMALDLTDGSETIAFSKDGAWVTGSGTTDADFSNATKLDISTPFARHDTWHIACGSGNSSGTTGIYSMNFGSPAFTISSGNADADGYGNFEYAVPSGYYALCTKNLGAYGG